MYRHILNNLVIDLKKEEQLKFPLEEDSTPVPKKKKKPSKSDPKVFNKDIDDLTSYLEQRGKGLTSEELVKLSLGKSSHIIPSRHRFTDLLSSDHVSPDVAKESLDKLTTIAGAKKKNASTVGAFRAVEKIIANSKLPHSTFNEIIENPDKYLGDGGGHIRNVLDNTNLDTSHLHTIAEKHPSSLDAVMSHEKAKNSDFINKVLSNKSTVQSASGDISRLINNQHFNDYDISPTSSKNILENKDIANGIRKTNDLDHLLGSLHPADRKSFIDKKLGIEGGSAYDPEKSNTEDDWDNHTNGSEHDASLSNKLATSIYLEDSHAEHIKRHGDFDTKYRMYHDNTNIDPKHGVEMFNKWKEGNEDHGYNSDELNEKNADEKDDVYTHEHLPDDIRDSILEEGRDSGSIDDDARESYDEGRYYDGLDEDEVISQMGDKYDDVDEIHQKLADDYDWKDDNPNSKQNEGRNDYDALNKLAERYDRSNLIDLDDFQSETGFKHPSEIGVPYDEERDQIDMDHVHDKLNEFGGPLEIDYANHDEHTISDHPEYESRYEDAAKEHRRDHWRNNTYDVASDLNMYEDYYGSDGYRNAVQEAEKDYLRDKGEEHVKELYSNSHEDPAFVPKHIAQHIPDFNDFLQTQKRKKADGGESKFLDSQIPNRNYEHEYGNDKHHHELAKDYADAKGGSVDVGTLHKMFPNQKETWKKMFGAKGKLSSEEIQGKIDEIPKNKYDITYGKWGSDKIQNLNRRNEVVVRLDHSEDSIKDIQKDPALYSTFKNVQEISKKSGHPTNDNTIGWARVDFTDPKNPMINEVQSDFGKTVREYLEKEGHGPKADHIRQIEEHHKNWRENLTNQVLKLAKEHGAEKVFTHSPESKAKHTGSDTAHTVYQDSYKKVPRSMGFKPVDAKEMPLTESGLSSFKLQEAESPEDRAEKHGDASAWHSHVAQALSDRMVPETDLLHQHHSKMAENHWNKESELQVASGSIPFAEKFPGVNRVSSDLGGGDSDHDKAAIQGMETGKPVNFEEGDKLLNQPLGEEKFIQGHVYDLKPAGLKKNLELAYTLIKSEILLLNNYIQKKDISVISSNIKRLQDLLGYGEYEA